MSSLPPPPPPPPSGGSPWSKFMSTPVLGALLAALLVVGAGVAVLSSGGSDATKTHVSQGSQPVTSATSPPQTEATSAPSPPPPIEIGRVDSPYDHRIPRVQSAIERALEDQESDVVASCRALTPSSATCIVTFEGASEADEVDIDQETGELSWVSRGPR